MMAQASGADDSQYSGFGLEGIRGADKRAEFMRGVLDHLGVRGGGSDTETDSVD